VRTHGRPARYNARLMNESDGENEPNETDGLQQRGERFARALFAFEDALDWARLEELYCDGDAEGFFDEERRASLREAGLHVADDLARYLGVAVPEPGASVYFGGSAAELAPWLSEVVVLERPRAHLLNQGVEARLLEEARRRVRERDGLELPPVLTALEELPGPLGHVWLVSVLTDPVAFPALHDELYERPGEANAARTSSVEVELPRARALLSQLFGAASPGALLTTTEEELGLARSVAEDAGRSIELVRAGPLTALVGDRLLYCRIR